MQNISFWEATPITENNKPEIINEDIENVKIEYERVQQEIANLNSIYLQAHNTLSDLEDGIPCEYTVEQLKTVENKVQEKVRILRIKVGELKLELLKGGHFNRNYLEAALDGFINENL